MKKVGKPIEVPEAESDEVATPTDADIERARVRAEEFSPLIAEMLDADEDD